MKNKLIILLLPILIIMTLFYGWEIIPQTDEKGITDNSVQKLDVQVNTIKEGLPFAIKRVKEWREDLKLDYIKVGFQNEKQITQRKGVILYVFYGENVKRGLDARAEVYIDMNSNSIVGFKSTYGTSKELLGGGEELNTQNWEVDIEDVMNITMKELGESKILNHEKPNIIIRCWEKSWEIAELPNGSQPFDDYSVEINPTTGEVLSVRDRIQDVN